MHVRTPFPYLGNGWTDCSETLFVVRGPLAIGFTQDGDVQTRARRQTVLARNHFQKNR